MIGFVVMIEVNVAPATAAVALLVLCAGGAGLGG